MAFGMIVLILSALRHSGSSLYSPNAPSVVFWGCTFDASCDRKKVLVEEVYVCHSSITSLVSSLWRPHPMYKFWQMPTLA